MVPMAISKDAARTYQLEYAPVFDAACRAAARCNMSVQSADPATGAITLSTSMSLASWGENIALQVGQLEPGVIQVGMRSGVKFGLVDWGKNDKNINRFFAALDAELGLSGPLPGVPPNAPQQMSPGPRGQMSPAPHFAPGVGVPGPALGVPTAPPGPPAGWHPDPSGRHEYRYWDGVTWTDQVSDAGAVSADPL